MRVLHDLDTCERIGRAKEEDLGRREGDRLSCGI